MMPSGLSGKPTLYGFLALSAMEIVALQKPESPLAKMQQPTRDFAEVMAIAPKATSKAPSPFTQPKTPKFPAHLSARHPSSPGFMTSSVSGATPHLSDISFTDLQSHWSQPFVELLAVRGIISGHSDGTFQPDSEIQAAHFSAMLHQAKLYRIKVLQQKQNWIANPVAALQHPVQSSGVAPSLMLPTEAEAESLLRSHDIRTRAQAAVFIYRNLQGTVVSQPPATQGGSHS